MGITDNQILYIDDEIVNLQLFMATFGRNYNISTASTTIEAEKLMNQTEFKVILSDIKMPHETGLDFFKRLPVSDTGPILILLTAYVNNTLLLEALNQGNIFRYLTKPWKNEDVRFTIDQAIQLFDLHNQNHQLYLQIIESHNNFYNIFQSSTDGILIINQNGILLEANAAFCNNINYPGADIIGIKILELIPADFHETIRKIMGQSFQSVKSRIEFEYVSSREAKKIVELISSAIEYKGESSILIIIRDITERKVDEQKILNAVILAEEKERSRIAKDLHDGLGPVMSTLKMYLEWLNDQDKLSDHPDILGLSLTSINEAIVTLKKISTNLSPHILEKFGLISALNTYIDNIKKVTAIQFSLNLTFTDRFDLAAEMSIYRIITECITNTIRHAKATLIELSLWKQENTIQVLFKDNGIGFTIADGNNYESGMGLHNMHNRIKTLGGKIVISSAPKSGTNIDIEIPIK